MDDVQNVQELNRKTRLAMALKQEAVQLVLGRMAETLSDQLYDLLTAPATNDRILDGMLSMRGIVLALSDLGYDVKQVVDLAARKAVQRQVEMVKLPQRRIHESDTQG